MSTICWACGDEVNAVITVTYPGPNWEDMKPREKRCMPCHEKRAPMNPEHYGKFSDMDLLTAAAPPTTSEKDPKP